MGCILQQPVFHFFLVRKVVDKACKYPFAFTYNLANAQTQRKSAAILPPACYIAAYANNLLFAGANVIFYVTVMSLAIRRGHEYRYIFAHYFFGSIPKEFAGSRVNTFNYASFINC